MAENLNVRVLEKALVNSFGGVEKFASVLAQGYQQGCSSRLVQIIDAIARLHELGIRVTGIEHLKRSGQK